MKRSTEMPTTTELARDSLLLKVLLACGVISSLVYVATDILASSRWEGYDWTARMVSDLFALSAPTRSFIVVPMLVYNLLILAFGIGVWLRGWNRPLRVAGALFIAYGVVSMLGLFVFPLNYEAEGAGATMHQVVTFLLILLMFLFIGFAAAGSGRAFRLYSLFTVAVILAGAILSGMQIPRIEAGLPTPGLGLFERLNIYSMLLWVAVFAVLLLRGRSRAVHSVAEPAHPADSAPVG
jgi:hypothetical membrane protein